MNNEDGGFPPEVQKFLDKYLHTEADRQLFIDTYTALQDEQQRRALLAACAEVPTEEELDEAEAEFERYKQSLQN
jgi:hypothetical protein